LKEQTSGNPIVLLDSGARIALNNAPAMTSPSYAVLLHAKSEIEIALGKHIEGLLREAQQSSEGQAA
jgi:hypothetical protein